MKAFAKALILVLGVAFALAAPVSAQEAEKPSLTLGVGGKALLYYLPLTVAERNGYFKDEGLDVSIEDFGGGSKSLQALLDGSVDVVTGAYEHVIRMQAQDIVSVIELDRYSGIVLVVRKDRADRFAAIKDLKGAKIGVTAPGSATNFFVDFLLAKNGLRPEDVTFVGVGGAAEAVAEMKSGAIDALSNLDPVITRLERDGDVVVLADSRTEAGNAEIFGGNSPGGVLYMKGSFLRENPVTTQKLTNALYRSLLWLRDASPEDVARLVPQEYLLGDEALYIDAVRATKPIYSLTGVVSDTGMRTTLGMLEKFDPALKSATIDLPKTFDARFVEEATRMIK